MSFRFLVDENGDILTDPNGDQLYDTIDPDITAPERRVRLGLPSNPAIKVGSKTL